MRYRPPRWPTDRRVSLDVGSRHIPVTVVNISRSGLKFRGPVMVPVGTRITVVLRGQPVPGRIAWSRATMAGVVFDRLLGVAQLAEFRQTRADTRIKAPPWWQDTQPTELK